MKGFGIFLIIISIGFGVAAFLQTKDSEMERLIHESNTRFHRNMKTVEALEDLSEFLGGQRQRTNSNSPAWESAAERSRKAEDLKIKRENRMWILSGISAVSFLAGIICISSAKPPASEDISLEKDPSNLGSEENKRTDDSKIENSDGAAAIPPSKEASKEIHAIQSSDSNSNIFLWIKEKQEGPWVIGQIRKMWDSGSITADTLYWCEGMEEWCELAPLMEEKEIPPPVSPVIVEQSRPKVSKVTFESQKDAFRGTMPLMVKLAMRAVQDLGWKLENANETLGLITFKTGISMGSWSGVSCSLNIEEIEDGLFQVKGTGNQNISGSQLIAMDFGEANRKASKAIQRMKELSS